MAVGVAVGVGVGVAVGVGVGAGLVTGSTSVTPLFQTNFLPDLTQVNFLPADVEMDPIFLQVAPAFTAENAGVERTEEAITSETNQEIRLFMRPE